jgi:hypothetical protein
MLFLSHLDFAMQRSGHWQIVLALQQALILTAANRLFLRKLR